MDMIKNIAASLVLLCAGGAFVSGRPGQQADAVSLYQGYEVSGTVEDELGPVAGAAVVETGTANGTSTDIDGRFSLTVSGPDAEIEISCIGYSPQIFKAGSVPQVINLKADTEYLDEIVVIGYGTVRKDDLTGSVSAVKAEDLNRGAVVNAQDMLKGKIAGLLVTPGDGGPGDTRGLGRGW